MEYFSINYGDSRFLSEEISTGSTEVEKLWSINCF